MFDWLVWFFWTVRRCKHEPGEWRHVNMGLNKIRRCKKCDYCTDFT